MKRKITCLIMCAVSCAMVAQTTGEEAGHTWIDMGLPSGIKWLRSISVPIVLKTQAVTMRGAKRPRKQTIGGLPTLMAQVINRSRNIQMLMA